MFNGVNRNLSPTPIAVNNTTLTLAVIPGTLALTV